MKMLGFSGRSKSSCVVAVSLSLLLLAGCDAAFMKSIGGGGNTEAAAPQPEKEIPEAPEALPDPETVQFEQRVSDLTAIRDALNAYQAENGAFPSTEGAWVSVVQMKSFNWIPELVPNYMEAVPHDPESVWDFEAPQYVYSSDGKDFKLIARKTGDCEMARTDPRVSLDPKRSTKQACWAYGFWTDNYSEN